MLRGGESRTKFKLPCYCLPLPLHLVSRLLHRVRDESIYYFWKCEQVNKELNKGSGVDILTRYALCWYDNMPCPTGMESWQVPPRMKRKRLWLLWLLWLLRQKREQPQHRHYYFSSKGASSDSHDSRRSYSRLLHTCTPSCPS